MSLAVSLNASCYIWLLKFHSSLLVNLHFPTTPTFSFHTHPSYSTKCCFFWTDGCDPVRVRCHRHHRNLEALSPPRSNRVGADGNDTTVPVANPKRPSWEIVERVNAGRGRRGSWQGTSSEANVATAPCVHCSTRRQCIIFSFLLFFYISFIWNKI